MTKRLHSLIVLSIVALFAASAFAQESRPTEAVEAEAELTEEDGSGEGEEVQERAVGPIRTATEANEVRQPTGPRSIGEGASGGDEDGDAHNGSGGN